MKLLLLAITIGAASASLSGIPPVLVQYSSDTWKQEDLWQVRSLLVPRGCA